LTSYVSTSAARRLIARMQATHERRRISVFAGPPGIGKTTAIDQFATRLGRAVAVVKIARRNARQVLVLQHVLDAVRQLTGERQTHFPSSLWDLREDLFSCLCRWAGADPQAARRREYEPSGFPPLTLVFDEAQNLSREAIEALRYWNDPDRCYAPFPLGLLFVGNNEFSLRADVDGQSAISAAIADRALYVQGFEYADLTDDDLLLFLEAHGVTDEGALAEILGQFRLPLAIRSLRRVEDLLSDLFELAVGQPVTREIVRQTLELA
jgi:MoxR-like ATPase